MFRTTYITLFIIFFSLVDANAQRTYREHVRKGNSHFADSAYDKAGEEYLKALELNTKGSEALYNWGNALLQQSKAEESIEQYRMAAQRETDKLRKAQVYHNTGVVYHAAKDYAKAVSAYKEALRLNPHDDMTRYNLALAMRELKNSNDRNQQQQEQQQEQQKQEQQEQQQQQQQQQEQQEQQKEEQQQEQEQQQQEQEMSKENAEQLLESAMQDEKDVQEKVKKLMQVKGRKLDKDW